MKNIHTTSKEVFTETSYTKLFSRFLRYGLLAWGGPIAQLALIEREMVYQEKLISTAYFNRLIAIYQAFPGPETHEICIHLGTQALGPFGGFLAGIGFMLPGFILMMFLSWLYMLYGITVLAASVLLCIKPAVIAWIVKGGIQLGRGILVNRVLWIIALVAFAAELYNVNFIITFLISGSLYSTYSYVNMKVSSKKIAKFVQKHRWSLLISLMLLLVASFFYVLLGASYPFEHRMYKGSALETFIFGLKCGSLSFGSVYSILAIIKSEAILKSQWLTQAQFIDGLALAGILPAPFIIVTTFVGFLAYGFWGGILTTIGTFLIPFLIPMYGYSILNKLGTYSKIRIFLDGITAGVAGLIAADVLDILRQILVSPLTIGIFIGSLLFISVYKSTYSIIWIIFMCTLIGSVVSFF